MRHLRAFLVLPALGAFLAIGVPSYAGTSVGLNFNVNVGPPVIVPEPPELVFVPSLGVYFVPGGDVDVFFYGGYWWEPRGPRWYRARSLHGPWVSIGRGHVPGPLFRMPHDYRAVYRHGERVSYSRWKEGHGGRRGGGHRERGEHGGGRGHRR